MQIVIKNMVCPRCITAVEGILKKLDLPYLSVQLGFVDTQKEHINKKKLISFRSELEENGFEIVDNKSQQTVEAIKTLIVKMVQQPDETSKLPFSKILSQKLSYDYNHLSTLFSSIEGTTIEHFLIKHKIEKVKELLVYGELTLSEIAFQLGYKTVSHLSAQFKKITGLTPSYFKQVGDQKKRLPLDKV